MSWSGIWSALVKFSKTPLAGAVVGIVGSIIVEKAIDIVLQRLGEEERLSKEMEKDYDDACGGVFSEEELKKILEQEGELDSEGIRIVCGTILSPVFWHGTLKEDLEEVLKKERESEREIHLVCGEIILRVFTSALAKEARDKYLGEAINKHVEEQSVLDEGKEQRAYEEIILRVFVQEVLEGALRKDLRKFLKQEEQLSEWEIDGVKEAILKGCQEYLSSRGYDDDSIRRTLGLSDPSDTLSGGS